MELLDQQRQTKVNGVLQTFSIKITNSLKRSRQDGITSVIYVHLLLYDWVIVIIVEMRNTKCMEA